MVTSDNKNETINTLCTFFRTRIKRINDTDRTHADFKATFLFYTKNTTFFSCCKHTLHTTEEK